MQNNRMLQISTAGTRKATHWPKVSILWSEFVEKIKTPVRGAETLEEYLAMPKARQDELKDVGGYGRILRDWRYLSENGPSSADVILLHETGVYVLETKDYGGWISGNPQEEYWVQTLWTGRYTSCQNYFYNPLLKLSGCIECMKKELPDMKWLPYYSIAVFGGGCELENAGLSDGERKIIYLKQLSYTMYGMIRSSHKFLSRQVIDEICDRLHGSECSSGLDKTLRLYYSKNIPDGRKP